MNNQSNITRYHLDSLYRIMLKRIAKGYSTLELSFLIGRETDYINQVEMLMVPFYTDEELKKIAAALEEKEEPDLLVTEDNNMLLTIAVKYDQEEQTVTRSYYHVNAEDEHKLLFMLKEEVLGDYEDDPAEAVCLDSVRALLHSLYGAGYFHQQRTALEIFHALRPLTAFVLSPFFVEWALDGMWDEENEERTLDKLVSNGFCLGFEAC